MADVEVDPVVRELSAALLPRSEGLAVGMADRLRAEIPLYAEGQFLSREELTVSCADNLRYILGNLAGRPAVGRDVPRATGAERAERGLPYAALLQAYRIGGRYIWELLVAAADSSVRDRLLRAAADIWAVTDDLSAQVTEGYRTNPSWWSLCRPWRVVAGDVRSGALRGAATRGVAGRDSGGCRHAGAKPARTGTGPPSRRSAAGPHDGTNVAGRRRLNVRSCPTVAPPPQHGALPAPPARELSGRDLAQPVGAAELHVALECARILGLG